MNRTSLRRLAPALMVIGAATFAVSIPAGATPDGDPAHDITLTIDAPAMAHEGDVVTYTFTATNTGKAHLNGVTITDDLFGEIGTIKGLPSDESASLEYKFTVPEDSDQIVDHAAADNKNGHASDDARHLLTVIHPNLGSRCRPTRRRSTSVTTSPSPTP